MNPKLVRLEQELTRLKETWDLLSEQEQAAFLKYEELKKQMYDAYRTVRSAFDERTRARKRVICEFATDRLAYSHYDSTKVDTGTLIPKNYSFEFLLAKTDFEAAKGVHKLAHDKFKGLEAMCDSAKTELDCLRLQVKQAERSYEYKCEEIRLELIVEKQHIPSETDAPFNI